MNKKLILLLAATLLIGGINLDYKAFAEVSGPFGYDLQKDINRPKSEPKKWETDKPASADKSKTTPAAEEETPDVSESAIFLDKYAVNPKYYPNATTKSAIAKYKSGNYTGSLQELYTILKKDSANATAYYYLAMVYTKLGETEAAKSCYQMVINLNPNDTIVKYAQRGKSCLIDSTTCGIETAISNSSEEPLDELDKFIQAPFGNGFSEELSNELRKKQLQNIQNKMNRGLPLSEDDLRKLEEYNKSEGIKTDRLAMANDMPSNDEIINAVQVLKRAGLNISTEMPESSGTKTPKGTATSVPAKVEPIEDEPVAQTTPATNTAANTANPANYYTPDPQIQQMTMIFNNDNNGNYDPKINMLPYMMQNEGKNMDPRVMQALMMNSMMNSLNGMNTNNNN